MTTEKIFCDPLHSLIEFQIPEEQYLIDVISTPTFQRLRRIKQLGVSSFVFHGAEHSRFTHSLGVTFITRKILNNLKEHYRDNKEVRTLIENNEKAVLLAALLHDTGHGPFSHLFEAAAPEPVRQSHESWTLDIIKNPQSDIAQILSSIDGGLNESVASIIERTHPCKFAVDLISSQLDADRIDYLLRDSMMTGAGYGKFDVEWLLKALRIGPDGGICVDGRKGIGAVENYMHSRYLMYVQVYFHKTGRAFEAQLIKILAQARKLLSRGSAQLKRLTPEPLVKALTDDELSLKDYLSLDDIILLSTIHRWSDMECGDEHDHLAHNCRDFYLFRIPWKSFTIPSSDLEKLTVFLDGLEEAESGIERKLADAVYFDSCKTSVYKGIDYYSEKETTHHSGTIMVLNDGRTSPLETQSKAAAVRALSQVSWAAHRLYFDRTMEAPLSTLLEKAGITAEKQS